MTLFGRQRRAKGGLNNPDAFREDGTWIKGRPAKIVSHGMRKTENRIAKTQCRSADVRKDCWNKAADAILQRYDTVYLGNWTDGTPAAKGKARDARKKEFKESGQRRAKGQAARQNSGNRVNRDNALGVFRAALEEKAKRSYTPKKIVVVSEKNTTRSCCCCGSLSG